MFEKYEQIFVKIHILFKYLSFLDLLWYTVKRYYKLIFDNNLKHIYAGIILIILKSSLDYK